MKIIMLMGLPSFDNLDLALFIKTGKYPNAAIFNRDLVKIKTSYNGLPNNSTIIDFAFIHEIKEELIKNPKDCIIIVAPFVLKETREIFYEAFKGEEFIGVWTEESKESILLNNSLRLSVFQNREEVIEYYLKYKVSPTPNEPFIDIYYISKEINTGMSTKYPIPISIEKLLLQI